MEQLVILVIIGLISLVNWMMQRSAELRERRKIEHQKQGIPEGDPFRQTEEEEPPPTRSQADPAADMRRLMEALGLPLEDEPPVVVREHPPAPPPLPQPPPRPAAAYKPAAPKPSATSRPYQIQSPSAHPHNGALAQSLRDKTQIRQAIILREVLGPPKAFTL